MQLSFEHRRGNARPTCVDMSSLSRLDPRRRPRYPAKQRILSCRHESCNAFINFPNMQTTRRIFLFRPPRDCSGARGEWLVARSPVFPDISCKAERRLRIGVLFRARAFKLIMDGRIPPHTHTHAPSSSPPLCVCLSRFAFRTPEAAPGGRAGARERERGRTTRTSGAGRRGGIGGIHNTGGWDGPHKYGNFANQVSWRSVVEFFREMEEGNVISQFSTAPFFRRFFFSLLPFLPFLFVISSRCVARAAAATIWRAINRRFILYVAR